MRIISHETCFKPIQPELKISLVRLVVYIFASSDKTSENPDISMQTVQFIMCVQYVMFLQYQSDLLAEEMDIHSLLHRVLSLELRNSVEFIYFSRLIFQLIAFKIQ